MAKTPCKINTGISCQERAKIKLNNFIQMNILTKSSFRTRQNPIQKQSQLKNNDKKKVKETLKSCVAWHTSFHNKITFIEMGNY